MLALTWRWTGYNMVFFLVGLQSLDTQIFEAAEVDGASKARQFFTITVPLLVPIILFSAVTSTSGTMQLIRRAQHPDFQGGPANATMTAALYIYRQAFFINFDFGYATAMSYVVVVISGNLGLHPAAPPGRRKERKMTVVNKWSPGRCLMWLLAARLRGGEHVPVLLDAQRHDAEPE